MCVILTNGIIGLRKRITATVLSLVIAFGSLPVISAFAESDEAFKGFSYWSVSGGELSAVSGISGYGAGISKNSGNAAKLTSELSPAGNTRPEFLFPRPPQTRMPS